MTLMLNRKRHEQFVINKHYYKIKKGFFLVFCHFQKANLYCKNFVFDITQLNYSLKIYLPIAYCYY